VKSEGRKRKPTLQYAGREVFASLLVVNTARLMEMFAPRLGVEGKKKGALRRHDIHSLFKITYKIMQIIAELS